MAAFANMAQHCTVGMYRVKLAHLSANISKILYTIHYRHLLYRDSKNETY